MVFVLDTSVLLSDPKALERLSDKEIIIPLAVVVELEEKRTHPELGFAARTALRALEAYRQISSLTEAQSTGNGGTIRVELNHITTSSLPDAFHSEEADNRILAVAHNLASEGIEVTLLTKDLPLRLKASVVGIEADDFTDDSTEDWDGTTNVDVPVPTLERLYRDGTISVSDVETLSNCPQNTGLILRSATGSALGRIVGEKVVKIREGKVFDISGRSSQQRLAINFLTDPNLGIVSLGGPAGTGKTLLALAAGLEQVVESGYYKRVTVFRPLYAVGGQDLGFLPGTAEEKMSPWTSAVFDALEVFCGPNVIEHVIEENLLEVLPLTHIRGRTLSDSFVIVDEAQNLEKMVLLTAMSRMGKGSKIVLTHDVAQRDNLRVGRYDGIHSVINSLKGEHLFAHMNLTRSERSPVAELVSRLLD